MADSKAKQIRILLGILSAGLVTGILIALSMLYYYNPTGSYMAKNMLLDPENAYTLRFIEPGSKGQPEGKYAFEGVYFSFFDEASKQTKTIRVPQEKYKLFYHQIAHESSIPNPDDNVIHVFNHIHPAILALKVRSVGEDASKGIEASFSEIVFAPSGDYYRIQVRRSGPGTDWAYFYHKGIYQKALQLFRSPL